MSYATYWWMVSMLVYSLLKQYIVSLHSELHRDGFIFKSLHVLINTATEHIGVSVRVGAALSPLVTGRAGNVSHCVSSCQCQMICCWHVAPTATNWLMFFFFLWCVWLFGTAYWLNNSQIWFVFTLTRHSNGILEQRHWLIYNKQLCSQIGRKSIPCLRELTWIWAPRLRWQGELQHKRIGTRELMDGETGFIGVIIPPIHAGHWKRPSERFSSRKEKLCYEAKPEKMHVYVKLSGSRLSEVHEQYLDTEYMWLLSFLS